MTRVADTRTLPTASTSTAAPQTAESTQPAQVTSQRRLARHDASAFGAPDMRAAVERRLAPASNTVVGNAQARNLGFEALEAQPRAAAADAQGPAKVSANVNVSNEDGPQSETDVAIDPTDSNHLIGGSNSISS